MSGLDSVVAALEASYSADERGQRVGKARLPSRAVVLDVVELAFQLLYPGYHGRQDLTREELGLHTGTLVAALHFKLATQIDACLANGAGDGDPRRAHEIAGTVVGKLPAIREMLLEDVQAAYDGDPAATSFDEILLAYPGLVAITVHRLAHELYLARVPLIARIMSEWAHTQSGADIHPGASIGRRFFIDHATGVVVGETTVIGDDVKLYQGVTLGALSIHTDPHGQAIREPRRHPTVEDGVTIYANATILGGETTIGAGSVIGGGVFVTKSVPPRSRVTQPHTAGAARALARHRDDDAAPTSRRARARSRRCSPSGRRSR